MTLGLKDTADFKIPTRNLIDDDNNFNYNTSGSINAYDRTYLDIINANRTFFFPPANVLVERSTDGGSTWTTVDTSTYTTQQRGNLLCGNGASLGIGTGNASTSQMLRITLQSPGNTWYCSLDRAYIRWSTAGHSNTVKIQTSTYGAQSTYTDLTGDIPISGWSGDNLIKFTRRTAWGTNNSAHLYNIRFVFKYSSVNSSYISSQASVSKIAMFGVDFWGTVGTPRYAGHLYNWDYQQNVTFPANVTASKFIGNATKATYLIGNGRIASADITHYYTGDQAHQRLDIATSSMTTNKPAGDGFINTYTWDNSGTYDSQFYMPNASNTNGGRPQVRYLNGGSTWSNWESLAKLSDVPTVNNATLTIQKNGTNVQTFTANQSTNATANITVPTATSELTNDSNFVNSTQLATKQDSLVSGTNIKTINGSSVLGSGDLTVTATVADDSISTAKIQDAAVTAQKIDWDTIDQVNYSTTPQKVGTWIDGSEIWRQTFTGTVSSGGDANGKVIGTMTDNIDRVVNIRAIGATGSSNRYATSQTYWSENIRLLVQVDKTTGNVTEYSGSAFGNNDIIVVVDYIKASGNRSITQETSEGDAEPTR